ncbi:MAG: hypothetical protein R2824_16815 [Saprospiraceae bacterium]|nr:hypothetical protein [Lewinella sp.]
MTSLRYAIAIIGALSLLLGLSLGQNYHQYKRIQQLEFNRFRQSGIEFEIRERVDNTRRILDRFREEAERQRVIHLTVPRYNEFHHRWEDVPIEKVDIYVK